MHAVYILQTTEDAENLEIAKSMQVGAGIWNQKQKCDIEWPKWYNQKFNSLHAHNN